MVAFESNTGAAAYDTSGATVTTLARFSDTCTPLADTNPTTSPTATPTETATPTTTETPTATATPTPEATYIALNDCYNVFRGVKHLSVAPLAKDIYSDPAILQTMKICAFSPTDGDVKLTANYSPQALDISVTRDAEKGMHHSTVTVCNETDGTSQDFDLAVNVLPVHRVVVKKLTEMRRGLHVIKIINRNDVRMIFNNTALPVSVAPNSSRKLKVPNFIKYSAFLSKQDVLAGRGKVSFTR
jgi:hypothetical protein